MARHRATTIDPAHYHPSQIPFFAVLLPLAAFMLLPIIFIFFHALKPIGELLAYPPRFFARRPTLENFTELLSISSDFGVPVSRYFFNSVVVSLAVVALTVIVSASAGYILSKRRFSLRSILLTMNTLALMFVPTAVSIPRYLVVARAGMIDSTLAHVVPLLAMPVGLFLLKQFIDQTPDSLIEAARMDGASDIQILFRVVMPIVRPALVTVAILSFQAAWNNAESSQLYINDESLKTFAFYVGALTSATGNTLAGQGVAAAGALLLFIPNLVLFIILQARVMDTMAYSGIK
jgi:multiple sugar transport system permease protein